MMVRFLLALALALAPAASVHADIFALGYGTPGPNGCSAWVIPGGNLFTTSPDPNFNVGWSASGATKTANNQFSPACATNGTSVAEDASTGSHYITATLTTSVVAATYTYSAFAKRAVGSRNVQVQVYNSDFTSSVTVGVDLGTCARNVSPSSAGIFTSPVDAEYRYSNGWCRISLSFTSTSTSTAFQTLMVMMSGSSNSYAGDGASSIGLWGAEMR